MTFKIKNPYNQSNLIDVLKENKVLPNIGLNLQKKDKVASINNQEILTECTFEIIDNKINLFSFRLSHTIVCNPDWAENIADEINKIDFAKIGNYKPFSESWLGINSKWVIYNNPAYLESLYTSDYVNSQMNELIKKGIEDGKVETVSNLFKDNNSPKETNDGLLVISACSEIFSAGNGRVFH